MVLLNNVKVGTKHFLSDKTYKKGSEWVSQLDIGVLSHSVLNRMTEFSVLQRECSSFDHAPIAMTMTLLSVDMDNLCTRANYLGEHAVITCEPGRSKCIKKFVHWKAIDEEMLRSKLQSVRTSRYVH